MDVHKLVFKASIILFFISIFAVGWLSNSLYGSLNGFNLEKPFYLSLFGENKPKDIASPYDHIQKDQIHVFQDQIIIDIKDASWAEFTDTNSMDPLLDIGANSFEIKPGSTENIHVGDVISYRSEYSQGLIVHRVIYIGEDKDGWYSRVKGDNILEQDPGKIRFEQIRGILVGIIY